MADKTTSIGTTSGNRVSQNSSVKDSVIAMKYSMNRPLRTVYSLDDKISKKVYPDFSPWEEDNELNDKLENSNCLKKGFFESPKVSNEYYSARNLIQETVLSSTLNCNGILRELSQHLIKSYKTRDDSINKIRTSSFNFRLPLRVTLTASKKESWLKELADPEVPLSKVSSKMPHGLRNKVLVDAMCIRNVPLPRAIWFTKCSLLSEFVLIRKKAHAKVVTQLHSVPSLSNDALERRWLQEWTQQVADYILKFSKEMANLTNQDSKSRYQERLKYMMSYIQALYIEDLLDKPFFLSMIVKLIKDDHSFGQLEISDLADLARSNAEELPERLTRLLKEHPPDVSQTLMSLLFVKVFWLDLVSESFLCKHLSEALLLNYFVLSRISARGSTGTNLTQAVPSQIREDCLTLISKMITDIFQSSPSSFILPASWFVFGEVLHDVIRKSELYSDEKKAAIEHTLALMNFRNESLTTNTSCLVLRKYDKIGEDDTTREIRFNSIHRSSDDILKLIDQLDCHRFRQALEPSLISSSESPLQSHPNMRLKAIISWCVSRFRDMGASKENLLIVCNTVKRKLSSISGRASSYLRNEVENAILECIFCLATVPADAMSLQSLYVLINELYQLKIITISAYLRKLIASGVFYSSPGQTDGKLTGDLQSRFHLQLLQNLPVLNNRQCDHILKKWTGEEIRFAEIFGITIEKLGSGFLSKIISNTLNVTSEGEIQCVQGLNVGLKFLVMNWFISELRSAISKSSRLIHVTPLVVLRVYNLFIAADNLNLFFKGFITFILKNDNKVIIFYMDSLYLINRLVLRHSELLHSITGATADASSASHNFFKLILQNYKDLASRETDMFDFNPLWKHISRCLWLQPHLKAPQTKTEEKTARFFGRESMSSLDKAMSEDPSYPMPYEDDSLIQDLEDFSKSSPPTLNSEESEEIENELEQYVTGIRDAMKSGVFSKKLRFLFEAVSNSTDDRLWFQLYKLLTNLKRQMSSIDPKLFQSEVFRYLEECMNSSTEGDLIIKPIDLCLAFELISCSNMMTFLDEHQHSILTDNIKERIFLETVEQNHAFNSVSLLLCIVRDEYRVANKETFLAYFKNAVEKLKQEPTKWEKEVLKALSIDPIAALQCLLETSTKGEILEILSAAMKLEPPVSALSEILRLAPLVNEFNLPMAQTMLCLIVETVDQAHVALKLMLQNLNFFLDSSNSFFGEIFNCCKKGVKMEVFQQMEQMFLKQPLTVSNTEATDSDIGMKTAIFKDYFMKLNDSFVEDIRTSLDQLEDLINFLRRFINRIETGSHDLLLLDIIAVFLRILIIRNSSLTDMMMMQTNQDQYPLIALLVRLLNSSFMEKNREKLKILLYDLLLLIKNSIAQKVTLRSEEDEISALSPSSHANSDGRNNTSDRQEDGTKTARSGVDTLSKILAMLNLQEPFQHCSMPFASTDCALTLSENELVEDSDVKMLNQRTMYITSKRDAASFESPFGEMITSDNVTCPFSIRSIQLIENTGKGINDGCINLSLLKAYTTKENEP